MSSQETEEFPKFKKQKTSDEITMLNNSHSDEITLFKAEIMAKLKAELEAELMAKLKAELEAELKVKIRKLKTELYEKMMAMTYDNEVTALYNSDDEMVEADTAEVDETAGATRVDETAGATGVDETAGATGVNETAGATGVDETAGATGVN